ncbi:bifunctional metallophosphatase/5'-nucleotidase [Vibrio sp. Of7-15]|uniref:bifunctional metallophosphatase/5'-nucleotidase n=1 Tax=Vibrio sp. Of7-15 TaxID=2724879 RepID=UPI001EF2148F|nr:5'-nucleotidase C-terminal domain-containing protein [Vibrio sp. Of7-15]MCG7499589.1 bifunctional metallophosphatase/5'-nucleotidase [Vibrio sp. Of7-15]
MLRKSLSALAISAALSGCLSSITTPNDNNIDNTFTLTIAHINDTHSNFDPVQSSFKANNTKVYNEFGGYPRLQTMAEDYKQQAQKNDDSFLFLHGGDAWQGSAYFKLNEGAMNADLLSKMGLDAMALGNHEFDLNNAKLNEFIDSVNFPVLAANIDTSEDADLRDQKNLMPYRVFAFDGNKKTIVKDINHLPQGADIVAVFGLALEDMANLSPNTGKVKFFNMVKSAQKTVDMFTEKGIHNVVAVTHVGNSKDIEIASQVNGIDLIVGGHSHTLLGDFTNLGMGNNGMYAQQVINPNNQNKTCVVQAGEYAQAIGRLQISFDKNGHITQCDGRNTLLSNDDFYYDAARREQDKFSDSDNQKVVNFIDKEENITITDENQQLRNLIDSKYKPEAEAAYGQVIAQVPVELKHERRPGDRGSDQHGSDVAPIIAEGQYYWANTEEVRNVTGMKVDFALIGAGGIRTNIEAGQYREGSVALEMLPFANFLSVLPVSGADIKAVIHGAITATLPEGSHAGKFPYGGHLRYSFTETTLHEVGQLDSIEVMTGSEEDPIWTPLEDDRTYNVVINNYNATGNDGWTPLFKAQQTQSDRVDLMYVDGKLTGFKVKNIAEIDGKYQVNYHSSLPSCKDDNVRCNTDAQSVIDYIANEKATLTPLSYEVVTFNRAQ